MDSQPDPVVLLADALASYTQVSDKTLAEYVLELYRTDQDRFAQELRDLGPGVAIKIASTISTLFPVSKTHEAARPSSANDPKTRNNRPVRLEHQSSRGARPPGGPAISGSPPITRDSLMAGQNLPAKIVNITKFGAFAQLLDVLPKTDGLIHISELADHRVENVSDVVRKGDVVDVHIIRIDGSRISLSMKAGSVPATVPSKKRLSSPERFEIRQLIASGAAAPADFDQVEELDLEAEEADNAEVEVRQVVPSFLTKTEGLELTGPRAAPAHIRVQEQDSTLAKAAETSSKLAKDRVESRARARDDKRKAEGKDPQRYNPKDTWKVELGPLGKRDKAPLSDLRKQLPVYAHREDLLRAVAENQVVVIMGATGSGKTTQIPQYLYEAGYSSGDRMIGCTQPRRVAAVSIAKRVAEELHCEVGGEVGYYIRFEDVTSRKTKIKYMTDGMLEREILVDRDLSRYSVIILDEAHERTIATDVVMALLKQTLRRRPDLRVLVTSATLDSERFSQYFDSAPTFDIPGRAFPVTIEYTTKPELDYLEAALMAVTQVHVSEPEGDILVFLTGQEEIDTSCELLHERMKKLEGVSTKKLIILPVYSALPSEMQSLIFEPTPPGCRKVIFATNIAETSVTIDGIRYVIDPGMVKINMYDPNLGMDSLKVVPISQAQANQRAGRAGRTGPGKCLRLYSEEAYAKEMLPNAVPEIQRQNLAHTLLMLKAIGVADTLAFGFLDPPPRPAILIALGELFQLGALDSAGDLTRTGRKMADFPMEPSMSRVLIDSAEHNCAQEMLSIMAMLSLPSVFYRPNDKREQADRAKVRFYDSTGDHMTLLNVYNRWIDSHYSREWCQSNFIHERSMRRAKDIREQLLSIMTRHRHRISSSGGKPDVLLKVLCSGYFRNTARRGGPDGYETLVDGTNVSVHPASVLFGKRAEYVLFHSLLQTTREYMHCVSVIRPRWLAEAAPNFFKETVPLASKRRKTETIAPLHNRYAENEDEWRISAQRKYVKYESTRF